MNENFSMQIPFQQIPEIWIPYLMHYTMTDQTTYFPLSS